MKVSLIIDINSEDESDMSNFSDLNKALEHNPFFIDGYCSTEGKVYDVLLVSYEEMLEGYSECDECAEFLKALRKYKEHFNWCNDGNERN